MSLGFNGFWGANTPPVPPPMKLAVVVDVIRLASSLKSSWDTSVRATNKILPGYRLSDSIYVWIDERIVRDHCTTELRGINKFLKGTAKSALY